MPPRKRKNETDEQLMERIREEIDGNLDALTQRSAAGQVDAVAELREETDALIAKLPVDERSPLRAKLSSAVAPPSEKATPDPQAALATAEEEVLARNPRAAELLEEAARFTAEGIRRHQEGQAVAHTIAEKRLELRLALTHQGAPDLMGRSYDARLLGAASTRRAVEILNPTASERDDLILAEESLARSVQNAMVDVRALRLRALDSEPEDSPLRAPFKEILDGAPGEPPSQVLARYYQVKSLQTRSERQREIRETKKAIQEAREAGDKETVKALTESTAEPKPPQEVIRSAISEITKGVSHISTVAADALAGVDADTRKAARSDLEDAIERLKQIYANMI